MTDQEHDRMEAAMDKRRRRLERYTGTPEAIKRRAFMEWWIDEWTGPVRPPLEPYPDPEP